MAVSLSTKKALIDMGISKVRSCVNLEPVGPPNTIDFSLAGDNEVKKYFQHKPGRRALTGFTCHLGKDLLRYNK